MIGNVPPPTLYLSWWIIIHNVLQSIMICEDVKSEHHEHNTQTSSIPTQLRNIQETGIACFFLALDKTLLTNSIVNNLTEGSFWNNTAPIPFNDTSLSNS